MVKLIIFFTFIQTFVLRAEVSSQDVESMLNQMVREHVISAKEATKVKARMKNISPDQWKAINHQASKIVARNPSSVTPVGNKIEQVQHMNLDGAQFKTIQKELQKIIPQYND